MSALANCGLRIRMVAVCAFHDAVLPTAKLHFRGGQRGPRLDGVVTGTSLAWPIDRVASFMITLRVLWLGLATYVSVYVAVWNADPLFGGE